MDLQAEAHTTKSGHSIKWNESQQCYAVTDKNQTQTDYFTVQKSGSRKWAFVDALDFANKL